MQTTLKIRNDYLKKTNKIILNLAQEHFLGSCLILTGCQRYCDATDKNLSVFTGCSFRNHQTNIIVKQQNTFLLLISK